MVSFKAAKWDETLAAKWAEYQELSEKAKPLGAIESKRDKLKKELVAAFGDEMFASLPDGTKVQLIKESRENAAREASTSTIYKLSQVPT